MAREDVGENLLRRELGVVLGSLVVINATIGTGIFKTPARVARLAGTLPASLAVWALGGVIAVCGALTLAELSAAMPRAGGLYEYLRRAYGPRVAFMLGWTRLTLLIPSATGSFARLGAESLASALGMTPDPQRETGMAAGILALCALASVRGVRSSVSAQGAITAVKYVGVVALALVGILVTPTFTLAPVTGTLPTFHAEPTWTGVFAALVGVMWAYDGWADLSFLAGEVKNPERTLPRALVTGTVAICAVYLAVNLGYARVLGIDGLRVATTGSNMAAARLAESTLGAHGRTALSLLVLVSCVGACLSSLTTGARMFVPMASDGLFVRWLGVVSPRTGAPARAVVVMSALGGLYLSSRTFEQLTEAFVVGYFPFYALAVVSVFVLRRKEPALARPFRVPGYPVVPAVFLVGAAVLMTGALTDADRTAWFAFGVLALGFPLSFVWKRAETLRS